MKSFQGVQTLEWGQGTDIFIFTHAQLKVFASIMNTGKKSQRGFP